MIKLIVNGTPHEVDDPPDTALLWVLRDSLQMTGTKFGCGYGLCGACTVHLDGVPTRACLTPISAVGKRKVKTIEGLAPTGGLHPLQEAWIANEVPQCGYCQSGQLMSAAALLSHTKKPSDDEITQAMDGNICRCGTYNRIRAAIHEAAERMRGGKA